MSHTPWKKQVRDTDTCVFDARDNEIASVVYTHDAAFIVRAVNSHAALVEALNEARRCLAYHVGKDNFASDKMAVEMAERVLAAAKGEA